MRYHANQEADANKRDEDRFIEAYHTASPVLAAVTRMSRPPAFTLRRMFLSYSLLLPFGAFMIRHSFSQIVVLYIRRALLSGTTGLKVVRAQNV
jgi:hypothetical protein